MKTTFILMMLALGSIIIACKPGTSSDTSTTTESGEGGTTYAIDSVRSMVKWEGSKPTGTHKGTVPVSGGSVSIKEGLITGGTVTMDMTRITVTDLDGEGKANLEAHLKGTAAGKEDDFFNVTMYPTATYTIKGSSKIENDPTATHLVQGDLTIKNITQPVELRAMVDMSAGSAIKITTAPFVIDRSLWEIKFMSKKFFDNLKDDFINDEVRLELEVGAIKQ